MTQDPSASSGSIKRYKTIYRKQPGTLLVSPTSLNWTPDVPGSESISTQQLSRIISMFTSKAGAAKTSAKLAFLEDRPPGGLTFQFTSPTPRDLTDRQDLQDYLVPFIAANKARGTPGTTTITEKVAEAGSVAQGIGAGGAALAEPSVGRKRGLPSDSPSQSRSSTPLPNPALKGSTGTGKSKTSLSEDLQLKRGILGKNPTLRQLHADLVLSKLILDSEFWDGRQHLIEQERLLVAQRPGIPSQLLDDRFGFSAPKKNAQTLAGGTGFGISQSSKKPDPRLIQSEEVKINVTRELQEAVFRDFPVVQEIYVNHVGPNEGQMNEQDFWGRYFVSKLWERHRASVRAGGGGSGRADTVFDMYLEAPDDDVEPREAPKRTVDMFLDLAATEEDHAQTGNGQDVTMQAGKQKATLPLIRRFNDHSNRLVALDEEDAATDVLGETMGTAEARLYSEIELDELRSQDQTAPIALDVQGQQAAFDGRTSTGQDTEETWLQGKTAQEIKQIILSSDTLLRDWQPNLPSVIPALPPSEVKENSRGSYITREGATREEWMRARKAAENAVSTVSKVVDEARQATLEQEPIPQIIMAQILTCHNAHTEFLRQFWSAILPTPPGTLGQPTAEQKMAKARKMATFLALMRDKVEGVVQSATTVEGVDPERVREALAPTLHAAEMALARWSAMTKGRK